jgi:hypothetical protein
VRRTALLLALLAGCAQQDPALLVTVSGAFRIPADADKLSIDVFDGQLVIKHKDWCATPAADCDALPPQPSLSGSITLVQSGAAHPRVKINVELRKATAVVGLGSAVADFQAGATLEVSIPVTRPQ